MPADFYIDAKRGVVFSKGTGVLGWAEAVDHMERLLQHPEFGPHLHQLADFRETIVTLTGEQIRELATRTIFGVQSKRAFVVATDEQFGISRMYGSYRDLEGREGVMTFREMESALAWLSLSSGPDLKRFTKLKPPT